MFTRAFNPPKKQSFFLLGPRGTGKTSWCKSVFAQALYIDLLKGLIEFRATYPQAKCFVLYGGYKRYYDKFYFVPIDQALLDMRGILEAGNT